MNITLLIVGILINSLCLCQFSKNSCIDIRSILAILEAQGLSLSSTNGIIEVCIIRSIGQCGIQSNQTEVTNREPLMYDR